MTDDKPWLSLSDEDPPERGLAELMAAARAKAEIMTSPPWWKRVLDLLRRPPVLALATVVVLVGGVIVVGHHPDEVQNAAPPPAVQPEALPPAPAAAPDSAPAVAVPAVDQAPRREAPPPIEEKPRPHHAPPKKSPGKAKGEALPPRKALDDGALELASPEPQSEDAVATPKADTTKPSNGLKAGGMTKPSAEPAGDPLARCRAAAANKDCAGARACARQVEAQDPQYYKANVDSDVALKSCL